MHPMAKERQVGSGYSGSDWGLSALLGLLLVDAFLPGPLIEFQKLPAFFQPGVFSLIVISGVVITLRRHAAALLVGMIAVVDLAARWISHLHPSAGLTRADSVLSLCFSALLTGVILVQVFRPGPINLHRIQGAIAAYLLIAFTWAAAYKVVGLFDPAAFHFATGAAEPQVLGVRLGYFSIITLTTVGYGDITPVSPAARSLAALEALIGQLFPAILFALLVSMELFHHQQRGGR